MSSPLSGTLPVSHGSPGSKAPLVSTAPLSKPLRPGLCFLGTEKLLLGPGKEGSGCPCFFLRQGCRLALSRGSAGRGGSGDVLWLLPPA